MMSVLKELEKSITLSAAQEKDRLKKEIEALKKQIIKEANEHNQRMTKEKQEFEDYKNAENTAIARKNKGLDSSIAELASIAIAREKLAEDRKQTNVRQQAVESAEKQVVEAKQRYEELAEKAQKKEQLFENKLAQLPS